MKLNLITTRRGFRDLSSQDEDSSKIDDKKREKRKIGFGFWVSIVWMILVISAALLAPILPISDPDQTGVGGRLDSGLALIQMVEICSLEQFGDPEFLSL